MDHATRDNAAPEGHAWDEAPPVLYRLHGPHGGAPWFAWQQHLRPATAEEATAYEAQSARARRN